VIALDVALLAGLAVVAALALLLEVPVPGGGEIPLGAALVLAVLCLARPPYGVVVAVGAAAMVLVRARPWRGLRFVPAVLAHPSADPPPPNVRLGVLAARTAASAVAAGALKFGLYTAVPRLFSGGRDLVVVGVLAVGVVYFGVDAAVVRRPAGSPRRRPVELLTVPVAMTCAAALLVVGYRVAGVEAALIAVIPLFLTRFSFARRAAARRTYEQTVQALGTLPEVAGFASLGHAERTAGYAALLCRSLGIDSATSARIATGCHLHHLGEVSLQAPEAGAEPVTAAQLGEVSEQILQDTGFLAGVAPLVAEVITAEPAHVGLHAAVIRVASTTDEAARRWPLPWGHAVPRGVIDEVLAAHPTGREAAVAAELVRLAEQRPEAVSRVAALRPPGSDLELHGPDAHSPTAV